jgi:hypothetical protein
VAGGESIFSNSGTMDATICMNHYVPHQTKGLHFGHVVLQHIA